jgi:transglutaminase-like putative cysteine protease
MHAWVRAWCGVETGWLEYDPTNAVMVGSGHVVVARGRDYTDVAPVKGILRTAGSMTSEQNVDMVPLDA